MGYFVYPVLWFSGLIEGPGKTLFLWKILALSIAPSVVGWNGGDDGWMWTLVIWAHYSM